MGATGAGHRAPLPRCSQRQEFYNALYAHSSPYVVGHASGAGVPQAQSPEPRAAVQHGGLEPVPFTGPPSFARRHQQSFCCANAANMAQISKKRKVRTQQPSSVAG